uniref:ATP-dependent DNA helicase n=1 Tax=Tanacetum cinerariifolium TaxID=118510 RepID=A0A6L2ML03_TANCI|nr:hypothetical protein [Tanacetum cinerariifolium]
MGVNLDKRYGVSDSRVNTFCVQGGIYYKVDQLVPKDENPKYLQLYFYDPETEIEHSNLSPLEKYRVELTTSVKDNQRLYNRPTTSKVEGNKNITTYKRSIVVYGRSEYPTQIQAYFTCYDPLSYLMFFPNGEAGWHKKNPRAGVDIRELIDDDDNDGTEDEEGDDSYPLYRRRDNSFEVNVRSSILDNRWVVLYNPILLMMFNCHINVEVCSSIKSVKYVFKYAKGHDKQVVNVEKDGDQVVNQIKRFQDARYVSPPEAMWFRKDDVLTNIIERERNKRSMLNAFFELNETDTNSRQYLYRDIPRAALERGLIKSDSHIHECLHVRKLWDDHYESLSEDYTLNCASVERVQNMVLTDISALLQFMGRSISDFDLPNITADVHPYAFGCRERQVVEAVDQMMQDITGVKLPFSGKIMVLGGDFRQVLLVVRRGTRAQIVDSSL